MNGRVWIRMERNRTGQDLIQLRTKIEYLIIK